MTLLHAHVTALDAHDNGDRVLIHPASPEVAAAILARDENLPDTRSQFAWVRLPNGDLVLGVFPQGDTYFEFEADAQYTGPQDDVLWCESCGERPQMVRTIHAGLCCICGAAAIDEKVDTPTRQDVWADENPDHPVSDWQFEVSNGDTRAGYWDWLEAKLEADQ